MNICSEGPFTPFPSLNLVECLMKSANPIGPMLFNFSDQTGTGVLLIITYYMKNSVSQAFKLYSIICIECIHYMYKFLLNTLELIKVLN
jgi:hypothetical protein